MSDLRARLIALAEHAGPPNAMDTPRAAYRGIAIAAARMALGECQRVCDDYPTRDPAEDGSGYWAAAECADRIRALAAGLDRG